MSRMRRSLGERRPTCFPTAPEFYVRFWDENYDVMHHIGNHGLFLDEFLDVLDNWAASRNFGDHIYIEDINSDDNVHYTVSLGS